MTANPRCTICFRPSKKKIRGHTGVIPVLLGLMILGSALYPVFNLCYRPVSHSSRERSLMFFSQQCGKSRREITHGGSLCMLVGLSAL